MMILGRHSRTQRGESQQEVSLVLVVCAVALIATLSVFVPGLRHLWLRIGQSFGASKAAVVQTDNPSSDVQER